jgi:hypothetical protein
MDLHESLLVVTAPDFLGPAQRLVDVISRVGDGPPDQKHAALSARRLKSFFPDLVDAGHSINWPSPAEVRVLQSPLDSQPYDEQDWWRGCVS